MVAPNALGAELAQPDHDGIGVGPIAHDIAQVPHGVDGPGLGQDRVEGAQVGVDIGQDGDAHQGEGSGLPLARGCRRRWAGSRG